MQPALRGEPGTNPGPKRPEVRTGYVASKVGRVKAGGSWPTRAISEATRSMGWAFSGLAWTIQTVRHGIIDLTSGSPAALVAIIKKEFRSKERALRRFTRPCSSERAKVS